jgi:hypothetical protein
MTSVVNTQGKRSQRGINVVEDHSRGLDGDRRVSADAAGKTKGQAGDNTPRSGKGGHETNVNKSTTLLR